MKENGVGMSEKQLLEFCADDNIQTIGGRYFDWTPEVYGSGKHLREYGYYPRQWKLYVHTSHGGPAQADKPSKGDLEFKAPIALYYNPRFVDEFKKISKKECYVVMAPMVFYRQNNKIEQLPEAKGTLAFVGHSTPLIDDISDIDDYINDLDKLPEEFHPISVMLHPTDVNKGLHKYFIKRGVPVYTSGNNRDYRFAERFYDTLRKFKFSTSNLPMSCLFYSVEMGIPHFLYGTPPHYINKGDQNIPLGRYDAANIFEQQRKLTNMFMGIQTHITPEQKEIVENELGINHTISRVKCAYVLYKALLLYKMRYHGSNLLSFIKNFKSEMRQLLKRLLFRLNYSVPKRFVKFDPEDNVLLEENIITKTELVRLKTADHTTSQLFGKQIEISDSYWHLHSLRELFVEEVYRFKASSSAPYILDCGANIGLSVIYFKRHYPNARIVAFEPDPAICNSLRNNIMQFGYGDVVVENKGLWKEDGVLTFNASGGLGGRIEANVKEEETKIKKIIKIDTVRLRNYLKEKVDFLKIDIEGAEFEVLKDCADLLYNVEHMFLEYHGWPNEEQNIDEFLSIIKAAGFRVYIREASESLRYPFLRKEYSPYYDLKLNIFCYRA